MLSKNNRKELARKQVPKRQRFTLKKLTVGVASVLIGFTFMGISAAADSTDAQETTDQPAVTDNSGSAAANQQTVTLSNNSSASAATESQSNSLAAQNSVVKSNSNEQSAAPTATDSETSTTLNIGNNNTTPVTSAELGESKIPAHSEDVSDWSGFIKAIENTNIDTINLTGDITVTGKTGSLSGQSLGYNGCLTLQKRNIARTLVINGKDQNNNVHTIDFGHYSLMFEDNNQENGSGWNITFDDIKMKGVSRDNKGTTSTTEPGTFGLISFADVSSGNQKSDIVTFKDVTANVTGRPVISGAKNITAAGLAEKLGETYTLNFDGTNKITNEGATSYPPLKQDSGNAVEAGYINFLKDSTTTINMTQTRI